MGHADASSRHEEVGDVSRIETSIGNGVSISSINATVVLRDGNKRILGKLDGVLFFGVVQID